MMEYDRQESAKFALTIDKETDKLADGVEKALADSASKGFAMPTGSILETVLGATLDTKAALTEANGKIYDDRRGVLYQQEEFQLSLLVKIAKLAYEKYREELFNALAIDQAQQEADIQRSRADVERRNIEIEARMVSIIRAKAEMEQIINLLKAELVEKETQTLPMERDLIDAKLATAEKKLEIIASIYKVLAAEKLVLAAEQRRADSLTLVLEAQRQLAAVKEAMVPYYEEKAKAKMQLADATIAEIPILKAIAALGYDRAAVKGAEAAGVMAKAAAEVGYIQAETAYVVAMKTAEVAREQNKTQLQLMNNTIQTALLALKKEIKEMGAEFELAHMLARRQITIEGEEKVTEEETAGLGKEMSNIVHNLTQRMASEVAKIEASAKTQSTTTSIHFSDTQKTIY
jgi:hypothetical protein